jgi:hypothetical protein
VKTLDGLKLPKGSAVEAWWKKNRYRLRGVKAPKTAHEIAVLMRREQVIHAAEQILGVHEIPDGSNDGPGVRKIQSATGAYRAPWCVSTVQYVWTEAGLGIWADGTAGAYYLASYAQQHGATIPKPVAGCAVVYHIGQGHAGTVVQVNRNGTFYAIEGNEGNAVRRMLRNPRQLSCTFILRPELR